MSGITNKRREVIRIVEIYPGDGAGEAIEGKLFIVSKMAHLKPGRHYNSKDKARIRALLVVKSRIKGLQSGFTKA